MGELSKAAKGGTEYISGAYCWKKTHVFVSIDTSLSTFETSDYYGTPLKTLYYSDSVYIDANGYVQLGGTVQSGTFANGSTGLVGKYCNSFYPNTSSIDSVFKVTSAVQSNGTNPNYVNGYYVRRETKDCGYVVADNSTAPVEEGYVFTAVT